MTREKLVGIVMDDSEAVLKGFDAVGVTASPYLMQGYRHDGGTGQGDQSARFVPKIPKTGKYKVSISYTALDNRATNVPVTIKHADGQNTVKVNQRKKPPVQGFLFPVGVFRFEKDGGGFVEITNQGTDGHVIVDTVQRLPAEMIVRPAVSDF
jgi:hypothetical protein